MTVTLYYAPDNVHRIRDVKKYTCSAEGALVLTYQNGDRVLLHLKRVERVKISGNSEGKNDPRSFAPAWSD